MVGRWRRAIVALCTLFVLPSADADIFRWDTGEVIPGTEGIIPRSGVQLDHRELEFADLDYRNLTGANFSWSNLTEASLWDTTLESADLTRVNLTKADLRRSTLTGASLKEANLTKVRLGNSTLTDADLTGANLTNANLSEAVLTGTKLTGAVVATADFSHTTAYGFTKQQLYSTASYQQNDLHGLVLAGNDLTGWNFQGQDLTDVSLAESTVSGVDLTGAVVTNADFSDAVGLTKEQLYATVSYQQNDLQGIRLSGQDLTRWDFQGQNMAGARMFESTLIETNLADAIVTGAWFTHTTWRGFTKEQLYSTQSYQDGNLEGIGLTSNDLTGWDFSGMRLAGASFGGSTLTNADFSGAEIADPSLGRASFERATYNGFTKEQLYSTASYQQHFLQGLYLGVNNFSNWDFSGQDLTGSWMSYSELTGADFSGAIIERVRFHYPHRGRGLTPEQVYSTASFQQKNLRGVSLLRHDLTGIDLRGQDLTDAELATGDEPNPSAILHGADFRRAILTGTRLDDVIADNAIWSDGEIKGLDLGAGDTLTIRDDSLAIHVSTEFRMAEGSVLEMVLEDPDWGSTMAVDDRTPDRRGTLRIRLQRNAEASQWIGGRFDLFDWAAPLDGVNSFPEVRLPAGTLWDLSQLDSTGEIVLVAVGQPGDFDVNGRLDALDIERLTAAVRQAEDLSYDVSQDGKLDLDDRRFWIHELKGTWFGDADLDGEFNSSDVVQVFVAGKYETQEFADCGAGDWNGDGVFDTGDFVKAFEDGGYEQGPRGNAESVPEPSGWPLLAIGVGVLCSAFGRRPRQSTYSETWKSPSVFAATLAAHLLQRRHTV